VRDLTEQLPLQAVSQSGKIISKCQSACLALLLVLALFTVPLTAARAQTVPDSLHVRPGADTTLRVDSTAASNADTSLAARLGIVLSPDALPSPVTTKAKDSLVLDLSTNRFYLYNGAEVTYEDLTLKSSKITYSQASGMVSAQTGERIAGADSLRATFQQGSELFYFDSLQYNFKTKRAIVLNARTQYGEGFIISRQVKRNPDQSIFGLHSVYTTCDLDTPHYGIRARRIKVVPNQVAVAGASNLEVEQVPTPLFLPFGLFPITQGQRSGFRLPTYTIEEARGLGLTNGGYYFYLSDYVDFLVTGSIYSKGSWMANGISTYAKRYHYSGTVGLSYAYNKNGESYEPGASINRSYWVNWTHRSDAKARPGQAFNAGVSLGSSDFFSLNSYNVNQIVNNQYQSNISYSKVWQGKPLALTVAARHNQNTQTRRYDITLPEVNFSVSQITPFRRKNPVGSPKWFEKINTGYTLNALAQTSFYDTAFSLNTIGLNDFQKGITHSIPISATYNVFRFINLSLNADYKEYWLTEQIFQFYDPATGRIDSTRNRGFYTARDFGTGANLSTRIYGVKFFKKGKVAGLRHVLEPRVGFNYTPDYAASPFGYYYQTSLSEDGKLEYRSPYESSIVGVPGRGQFGNYSSSLSFGLNNNLQMKVRQKAGKDTAATTKNISLIDGLNISSAYNLAADSFNWSPLVLSFRTNILNKLNITAGATFDPYAYNYEAGRRDVALQAEKGRGLARFERANISLDASLNGGTTGPTGNRAGSDDVGRMLATEGYENYVDFSIPWNLHLVYSLNIQKNYRPASIGADTLLYNQNLLLSGDFNVTPRWKVALNTGYDFTSHSLTITSIDIYRDLHCWEMRLNTIPFGARKSFNFSLNVKASVLQDLRLQRRRDYRDAL